MKCMNYKTLVFKESLIKNENKIKLLVAYDDPVNEPLELFLWCELVSFAKI